MISVMERHQHAQDKFVRSCIKSSGKLLGLSYPDSLTAFRACEIPVTEAFWFEVNCQQPGRWVGVSYCLGCRKFSLEVSQ